MRLWFHRHQWGKPENGYQCCTKCGIARPLTCAHKWKTVQRVLVHDQWDRECKASPVGEKRILQCEHCGEIKTVNTF